MMRTRARGFTLVELGITLTIITLLMAMVLGGMRYVQRVRALEIVSASKDLMAAARAFRDRYHYWPGDMPRAKEALPTLADACNFSADGNHGDGQINAGDESACAIEHLLAAGLIKAGVADDASVAPASHRIVLSEGPSVRLSLQSLASLGAGSGADAATLSRQPNVLLLQNASCEAVQEIDRRLDDDALGAGRAWQPGVVAGSACTGSAAQFIVLLQ